MTVPEVSNVPAPSASFQTPGTAELETIGTVPRALEPTAQQPLTIVGWLWRSGSGEQRYTPKYANLWARMIHRHLTIPHRFVLLTDQLDADYDPLIEPVQLWDHWREFRNPALPSGKPQCYVRLFAFSRQAADILGDLFVSMDLDLTVHGNLDDTLTFGPGEDFKIIRRTPVNFSEKSSTYQGSMWMMRAGAREQVWTEFKGAASAAAAREFIGSDQAWIRHVLGAEEKGWTEADGVYCFRNVQKDPRYKKAPPPNARVIFFNTGKKPWSFEQDPGPPRCQQCQAEVKIVEPYSLTLNRNFYGSTHSWVRKFYK